MTGVPDDLAKDSLAQTSVDLLGKATIVRTTLVAALRKHFGIQQAPSSLTVTVESVGKNRYHCESNIPALLGFDELKAHHVLERALLGVAGMNMRIEEMRRHNALSGFDLDDVPVFDEKLRFLTQLISPEGLESAFCRVVELGGLPGAALAGPTLRVDVDRLLKARESKECEEFRCWLGTSHRLTDSEIKDYMASFRAKLAGAVHSSFGTTIRWLVSTGVGLMPMYGTAIGAACGLIDAFLLEKVLPYDGPVAFISRKYPSIFELRRATP